MSPSASEQSGILPTIITERIARHQARLAELARDIEAVPYGCERGLLHRLIQRETDSLNGLASINLDGEIDLHFPSLDQRLASEIRVSLLRLIRQVREAGLG